MYENCEHPMKYCSMKAAKKTRELCIENHIILEKTKEISLQQFSQIVNLFSGDLIISDESLSYFKMNENKKFTILIGSDVEMKDRSLTILEALGLVFLEDIKEGQIIYLKELYNTIPNPDRLYGVETFAREFLMPENLFDESLISNNTEKGFDCLKVAEDFNTNYMKVLARGEDLKKW